MAAGNCDYGAGGEDARSGDGTLVDSLLQAKRRSAHVANCGESPQQRGCRLSTREQVQVTDICREQGCDWRTHKHRVPVHVDETGHEGAPAAVDDSNVSVRGWLDTDARN